ncbi:MAG: hypothetical protein OEM20_05775 [Gammaproteobacteria bacterium]|nr:hypothetical protein [Gammaproteobacteria bacterium]MDH3576638.1 hypothetical protein [Gammaproteobacteria bacterium]
MSSDQKDEEMICALTADEHDALQQGLRGLKDTMPPRAVWNRIREQAKAEGLLQKALVSRRTTWFAGAGVAAAALLAALIFPGLVNPPAETFPVVPSNLPTNTAELSTLQTLMVQSRQLERDLRSLPDEPRVMRASTVATISDLEDRIAAIDYQLNNPDVQMTSDDKELFWRERVRLINSLLQLRYAQAQRAAF